MIKFDPLSLISVTWFNIRSSPSLSLKVKQWSYLSVKSYKILVKRRQNYFRICFIAWIFFERKLSFWREYLVPPLTVTKHRHVRSIFRYQGLRRVKSSEKRKRRSQGETEGDRERGWAVKWSLYSVGRFVFRSVRSQRLSPDWQEGRKKPMKTSSSAPPVSSTRATSAFATRAGILSSESYQYHPVPVFQKNTKKKIGKVIA